MFETFILKGFKSIMRNLRKAFTYVDNNFESTKYVLPFSFSKLAYARHMLHTIRIDFLSIIFNFVILCRANLW
jgi:hypothetical protein